ncbi:MAG: chromate resistance protein ChrB domain-containing protein, partial [Candidatus Eisenbacteria bacterium]
MPSPNEISVPQLARLVGTPDAPILLDVRNDEHYAEDPRVIPGATRRVARTAETWASEYAGQRVVVTCHHGAKLSQGVAAWLRHEGAASAESLEGGHEAWAAAGALLLDPTRLPRRDAKGRTVWVTRTRPKVDRIACPWLLRRFVDRDAVILFVAASEVQGVADRFQATPFDIEGVPWSHRGDTCTFDTMLTEFGLDSPALRQLALIVRGADTARLDLAPQSAGLYAISLGLSN